MSNVMPNLTLKNQTRTQHNLSHDRTTCLCLRLSWWATKLSATLARVTADYGRIDFLDEWSRRVVVRPV